LAFAMGLELGKQKPQDAFEIRPSKLTSRDKPFSHHRLHGFLQIDKV
jgi:hypothetical protein